MLQNCSYLSSRDTREPLKEIVDGRTVFDIVKKRKHWHTSAFENPSATDFTLLSFYFWTAAPVTAHNPMLTWTYDHLKFFLLLRTIVHKSEITGQCFGVWGI
jgi:hypothetical protein